MIILWLLDISCNDDIFVFFYILITIKRHSSDFFLNFVLFSQKIETEVRYTFLVIKMKDNIRKKYKDNKYYHILQLHIN